MSVGPFHILMRHDKSTDGFIKDEIDFGVEWRNRK